MHGNFSDGSAEHRAYRTITACLERLAECLLEIEILPTALCPPGPPSIVQDGQAVGIPKALLIPAFKHATSILALGRQQHMPGNMPLLRRLIARVTEGRPSFEDTSAYSETVSIARTPSSSQTRNDIEQHGDGNGTTSLQHMANAILEATMVVLLVAPEHLTAANIRKRNLLALHDSTIKTDYCSSEAPLESSDFCSALQLELNFVNSLLTSPLHKHAKSPTLWSHRRWLVMKFMQDDAGLILNEFDIVSRAAVQHPRNYPAFDYLRRLITLLTTSHNPCLEVMDLAEALRNIRGKAHTLALRYPSDTSIWAFWQYISSTTVVHVKNTDDSTIVEHTVSQTLEMALRLRWRGEAVWGCLRCALASTEVVGMRKHERKRGLQRLQDWLGQHSVESMGNTESKTKVTNMDSESPLDVTERDVEELRATVERTVAWIDKNWKDDG